MTDRAADLLWLAERISPEREGFAWGDCRCGDRHYRLGDLEPTGEPWPSCPDCHGTGRVPAPLDQPAMTLTLLLDWAQSRPWCKYGWWVTAIAAIDDGEDSGEAAEKLFNVVYSAEREWAKEHLDG